MDDLLAAINEHYHAEGEYPIVKVKHGFYAINGHELFYMKEYDGIAVEIDDNLNQDWELV